MILAKRLNFSNVSYLTVHIRFLEKKNHYLQLLDEHGYSCRIHAD